MNVHTPSFGEVTLVNYTQMNSDDFDCALKMRNHPEIKKWMYNQSNITEAQHGDFIERLKMESTQRYFLVKQGTNIIGSINFTNIDNLQGTADFGLYANPFDKATGAGRILEESSIVYAEQQLKMSYLNLDVFESNTRAIGFYSKNGYVQVGTKVVGNHPVFCMQKKLVKVKENYANHTD